MMVGEILADRYRLCEPIGSGATAVVWRAEDLLRKEMVALKLRHVDLSDELCERFEQEIDFLAGLNDPSVITVLDEGHDPRRFYVMELMEESLEQRLQRHSGPLPVHEALSWLLGASAGLAHAARQGIEHRDIKPGNLLRASDGRVVVADFGTARAESRARLTPPGRPVFGTPPYIAPEVLRGEGTSSASDCFSLGCMGHEMLAVEPPWKAGTQEGLLAEMQTVYPARLDQINPHVSAALASLVADAIALDPRQRYAHPDDLLRDLRQLSGPVKDVAATLHGAPVPECPERRARRPILALAQPHAQRPARRKRRLATGAGSLFASVPVVLLLFVTGLADGPLASVQGGSGPHLFTATTGGVSKLDESLGPVVSQLQKQATERAANHRKHSAAARGASGKSSGASGNSSEKSSGPSAYSAKAAEPKGSSGCGCHYYYKQESYSQPEETESPEEGGEEYGEESSEEESAEESSGASFSEES
jgi:serine/threonine protein kinase